MAAYPRCRRHGTCTSAAIHAAAIWSVNPLTMGTANLAPPVLNATTVFETALVVLSLIHI